MQEHLRHSFRIAPSFLILSLLVSGCYDQGEEHRIVDRGSSSRSSFPAVSCRSAPTARSIDLIPNAVHTGLLGQGESHSYSIKLTTGSYLQIMADQAGADLVLCLYDPTRHLKLAVDSPNGREEPEELLWSTQESGTYHLVIYSLENDLSPRPYSFTSRLARRVSDTDQLRLVGIIAAATAEELRRSNDFSAWPQARREYLIALGTWERLGEKHRQADLQARLGRLYRERLSDLENALTSYRRAHMLFAQLGERRRDAQTLAILGKTAMALGRFEEAQRFQRDTLKLFQGLKDLREQAIALNEIGFLDDLLGEPHAALESYSRALEIWSRIDDKQGKATTLHNRALLYSSLGVYADALDDWEEARTLQPMASQAAILTALGTTYALTGQPQKALPLLNQALSLRITSKDRHGQAVTQSSLGFVLHELGRRADALEHHRAALEILNAVGDSRDQARAFYNYGLALRDVNRTAEAIFILESAVSAGRRSGDEQLLEASLFALAQMKRDQGDQFAALALIQEALERIEDVRLKSASQDLRASFFATKQDYYDFAVDLLMELDRRMPGQGYQIKAFNVSERSRARSLLELLQESGSELRENVPARLTSVKRRLEIEIRAKSRFLIRQQYQDQPGGTVPRLESELRALLRDYDRVNAEIRVASPGYRSLIQAQPLTAMQIQRQVLDPETLLLHYQLGKRRSYLWLITPHSIETFTLPSREVLEHQADRAYKLLANPISEAQAELTLRKLSDLLLGQVWERLEEKRLLIVGQGSLQFVPFAALPEPSQGADEPWQPLIIRHELVTMPSVSALAMLKSQQSGRWQPPERIAVLADPVFSADDVRVLQNRRPTGSVMRPVLSSLLGGPSSPYPRLLYSRLEAQAISSIGAPKEVLRALDFSANRKLVLSGILSRYQIIHFATHGEIDTKHPELSRLVLSLVDEEGRPQDGLLYAHEIFDLRLPAQLVVLSACQTGIGPEIRGEGLVGLPQAFLYAGAARVVVSLWNVNDRATSLLFSSFYRHLLLEGKTPSAALRLAQIEQWKKRPWPYHWAAFVIQGRWR